MARRIALFADGTGNAFSRQESNVFRLYEALDMTAPDQCAMYIPGVGTSSFAPFATLDAITGIGVPANVRALYLFLCWNWQPDDEIYIFGFSRGSFTARTLVGLIASQGLVANNINGTRTTHNEMQRNAKAAWRAYRAASVQSQGPSRPWPTITLARTIRDAAIAAKRAVCRQEHYKATQTSNRRNVPIHFLGVFDTVEAYGVPIEEFRRAIDVAIWPISFRNGLVSSSVEMVRHALALDEERTTFTCLRFEIAPPSDHDHMACCRFRGHPVWVFHEAGGVQCKGASSVGSLKSRPFGL